MPITDARTPNRNYPKAVLTNRVVDEFTRLIELATMLDIDVAALFTSLAGKANVSALSGYQATSAKNLANGYPGLDGGGKIDGAVVPFFDSGVIVDASMPPRLGPIALLVDDWDQAVNNGFYRALGTALNAPVAEAYSGLVRAYNGSNIVQTLVSRSGVNSYRRTMFDAVWGAWEQVRTGQAELDARYGLISDRSWKKVADVNLTAGSNNYDIPIAGNRFMNIHITRLVPTTDGVSFNLRTSTDGTNFVNLTNAGQYVKDIAGAAGAETALSSVSSLFTGGAAVGVSSNNNEGGWNGAIRLNNVNQARPLSGEIAGNWKNGAVINAMRGSIFDSGVVTRTHLRITTSGGTLDSGRIVVLGIA